MAEISKMRIIPTQLVKGRESLGLQLYEVAEAMKVDIQQVQQWEKGDVEPSIEELWNLAEIYKRSTDYFLRPLPALPENLNFRLGRRHLVEDLPPKTREVLVRFEELCRAETELENAIEKPRKILLSKHVDINDPVLLANNERLRLGLYDHPIHDIRNLLWRQGVRIFVLPIPDIPSIELSGLSWWHNQYGPCMLINARNTAGRRSFTIAHEYAHLLHSDPPTICALFSELPDERFADRFAATFLMPESALSSSYSDIVGPPGIIPTDKQFGMLSARFSVSLEAMGRRLEDLNLVPKGTTDARIIDWEKQKKFYRSPKGPKWRRQIGETFIAIALEAYSEGQVSAGKLARYFGVDIREVSNMVNQTPPTRKRNRV